MQHKKILYLVIRKFYEHYKDYDISNIQLFMKTDKIGKYEITAYSKKNSFETITKMITIIEREIKIH